MSPFIIKKRKENIGIRRTLEVAGQALEPRVQGKHSLVLRGLQYTLASFIPNS